MCIIIASAVHLYRLMILRIEDCRCEIISLYATNNNIFDSCHFRLNSSVATDSVTYLSFLTTGIEPSTKSKTFCYLRQCTYFRQNTQRCTFIRLYFREHGTVLILENHLTRSDLSCLCFEIVAVLNRAKMQSIRIAQINILEYFIGAIRSVATGCRISKRSNLNAFVVLNRNRLISIGAVANSKTYSSIYRHRNTKVAITMLVGIERSVCIYAFRKCCKIVL